MSEGALTGKRFNAHSMTYLAPADCLVVEDAKAGIEAAARGGFDSAAIGDAFGDGRARYHMERLSDLPGLILRANQGWTSDSPPCGKDGVACNGDGAACAVAEPEPLDTVIECCEVEDGFYSVKSFPW